MCLSRRFFYKTRYRVLVAATKTNCAYLGYVTHDDDSLTPGGLDLVCHFLQLFLTPSRDNHLVFMATTHTRMFVCAHERVYIVYIGLLHVPLCGEKTADVGTNGVCSHNSTSNNRFWQAHLSSFLGERNRSSFADSRGSTGHERHQTFKLSRSHGLELGIILPELFFLFNEILDVMGGDAGCGRLVCIV